MISRKRPISEVEGPAEDRKSVKLKQPEDGSLDSRSQKPQETQEYSFSFPPRNYTAAPVLFQQPSTLLTFSYTPERVLEFTDSSLRYYTGPPLRADLKYGYDRWIKRPEEKGRLDGLLIAISKYQSKVDSGGGDGAAWLRDIAVVSWRGVMTK